MIGAVSREVRYRVAGGLIIAGLLVETWSLFQMSAAGFMIFLGISISLLTLGILLNVYWVSLELATSDQVLQGEAGGPESGPSRE